uniref:Uncharacterized protein n=1 Tax=Timema tahoe TaxID=61484 RepID=A0A7R9NYK5_9NEOP|nr:unnamed protein product [Timema tahoe]
MNIKDMKEQFARYLYEMNFLSEQDVKAPTSNVNSNNLSLVKAIICAGLYPNIAIIKSVKRRNHTGKVVIRLSTPEDGRVELHPKSINEKMSDFESRFLLYHLKLKSTAIFLHDTTMVYPLPLLFFGEGVDYYEENGTEFIAVNNSIRFRCRKSTSSLVKDLRNRLDGLLEHKVTHPGVIDWSRTSEEGALLRAIIELITYEDKQLMIAQEGDDDNFSN